MTDCSSSEPTYILHIIPGGFEGQYLFASSAGSFDVADAGPPSGPESYYTYNSSAGTLSDITGSVLASSSGGFNVAQFQSGAYQASTGATTIRVTINSN